MKCTIRITGQRLLRSARFAVFALAATSAAAHEYKAGDIVVDHPYATPAAANATGAAVHFRTLANKGHAGDRLLWARTPLAASVDIERVVGDAGATRVQVLPALDLPTGTQASMRHDGDTRLRLVGLKTALTDGQRFPLMLHFEHAGDREVTVWVQTPRPSQAEHRH